MRIDWAALSDRGRRRASNEDAFLADSDLGLFVVADGMGGHAAGEVASRLAVDTLHQSLSGQESLVEPRTALENAVRQANQAIFEKTIERQDLQGMGTTLVFLLAVPSTAWIGHVGDSRAYRIRNGSIQLLTHDHSWVGEQVRQGLLSPQEARKHPWRNVVTRALGSRDAVELDLDTEALQPGDQILLCSDGLNTMLGEEQILDSVHGAGKDLEGACRRLVDGANQKGGEDNVTVLLLRASAGATDPKTP